MFSSAGNQINTIYRYTSSKQYALNRGPVRFQIGFSKGQSSFHGIGLFSFAESPRCSLGRERNLLCVYCINCNLEFQEYRQSGNLYFTKSRTVAALIGMDFHVTVLIYVYELNMWLTAPKDTTLINWTL